jgi:hypothetical protein
MARVTRIFWAAFLLNLAGPAGFCQLRYPSPYSADQINTDQTSFILKDSETATFRWVSEWTQMTVQNYEEKDAIFVWHFKDGTKAFSAYGQKIGDSGNIVSYLLTGESAKLESAGREKVQPLTLANFPVKVELWIGDAGNARFEPGTLIDAACSSAQSIEYGRAYHFVSCNPE